MLAALVVGAVLVAMVQRDPAQPLLLAAAGAAALAWGGALPSSGSGLLELHLLDVGQGDAIALRTPHGQWIVVDAGGGAPGIDRGRRMVIPYLRRLGGPVAAFVLSHPHLDHVGGAPALIGALTPTRYFDAAFAGGTEAYRASLESAAVHRVLWQRVHPGETADIDGVRLRFLAPDSAWTAGLDDANLASTMLRVEYGTVSMLLVGDAERAEEEWVIDHADPALLKADVLKVGHHGSRTSSTPRFLDAVAPRVALVSVGRGNSYGLPSASVLEEYARRRIPLLRTDVVGTTVVRTDGLAISVSTSARQWSLPSRPSVAGYAGPYSSP
jgi:competence protein ComEC